LGKLFIRASAHADVVLYSETMINGHRVLCIAPDKRQEAVFLLRKFLA
jgi:uncharacterized protein (UPF0248 family)